jgi:hypothetical protein
MYVFTFSIWRFVPRNIGRIRPDKSAEMRAGLHTMSGCKQNCTGTKHHLTFHYKFLPKTRLAVPELLHANSNPDMQSAKIRGFFPLLCYVHTANNNNGDICTKSGNLNFLEPSGPLQACNETALYRHVNFQQARPLILVPQSSYK